ncbi:MAG: UbiA family prenyltransferase [Elioraea sp.]|nr:UbiA family prenyltransferase [Elioraea sp.]
MLGDAARLPLCVDLDGTLLRTDTLVEGVVRLGLGRRLAQALVALARGRAAFKAAVAEGAPLDPSRLPYNEQLVAWLAEQKRAGRRLVLATAANERVARAIADHLGLFDEVIASGAEHNLKGSAKAAALVDRFGQGGFSYVGDSAADAAVWRRAGAAVLVGPAARRPPPLPPTVVVEARFDNGPGEVLRQTVRALRPHQWSKNLLVFVPLIAASRLDDWAGWAAAVGAFLAFSAAASAVYLINDLTDLDADRAHATKRHRPFASGALPLTWGLMLAPILSLFALLAASLLDILPHLVLYGTASSLYSAALKTLPLVDVFTLSALYGLRLVAGGAASGHPVSKWLFAFSGFLFLSLALMKRVAELGARPGEGYVARRGYMGGDREMLALFGVASAFSAAIVLALFIQSSTAERFAMPDVLPALVPLALFWLCRMWLSTARGYMLDDPIVYAAKDWVSWCAVAVAVAVVVLAGSADGSAEASLGLTGAIPR